MINRVFITFCLFTLVAVSVHADDSPIEISLGIRDNKFFTPEEITKTPYPLAFRIKNTGKTVIGDGQAEALFISGFIHVQSKDGKAEYADFKRDEWSERFGLVQPDLKPGDTFENKIIVNLLDYFPLIRDGDYQVWWSVYGLKSNKESNYLKSNFLHFRVTGGKLQLIDEKPNTAPDPKPTAP